MSADGIKQLEHRVHLLREARRQLTGRLETPEGVAFKTEGTYKAFMEGELDDPYVALMLPHDVVQQVQRLSVIEIDRSLAGAEQALALSRRAAEQALGVLGGASAGGLFKALVVLWPGGDVPPESEFTQFGGNMAEKDAVALLRVACLTVLAGAGFEIDNDYGGWVHRTTRDTISWESIPYDLDRWLAETRSLYIMLPGTGLWFRGVVRPVGAPEQVAAETPAGQFQRVMTKVLEHIDGKLEPPAPAAPVGNADTLLKLTNKIKAVEERIAAFEKGVVLAYGPGDGYQEDYTPLEDPEALHVRQMLLEHWKGIREGLLRQVAAR